MKKARDKIKGLYAIVDNTFSPDKSHIDLACEFLVGGCRLLQLRMKMPGAYLWDKEVFETASKIIQLKDKYKFTFIINDFVDVAAEIEADGVHVGANDMSITDIRKRTGKEFIIGYSSHSLDEAIAAEKNGADYVAFGAIYPTKTKGSGHPVQGIEKLKDLVREISVPVVAIGGINRLNVDNVISTGVASVALITGLTQAKDVARETLWYAEKFKIQNQKSGY